LVVFLALASAIPSARAGEGRGSPYDVDWMLEVPLTLTAAAIGESVRLVGEIGGPTCGTVCDGSTVNPLDRWALGNRSPGADTASTWIVDGSFALSLATAAIDVLISKPEDGWTGFAKDILIYAEVLSVNLTLNNAVKYAVRRNRPYAYDRSVPVAERTATEASLSFYSMHTSSMFAGATVTSYTFMLRHPDSPLVIPAWIVGYSLGVTAGALRIYSGNHFLTDVLVGAAVGIEMGLVIPWAHLKADELKTARAGRWDAGVIVMPYFAGETVGITGAW